MSDPQFVQEIKYGNDTFQIYIDGKDVAFSTGGAKVYIKGLLVYNNEIQTDDYKPASDTVIGQKIRAMGY